MAVTNRDRVGKKGYTLVEEDDEKATNPGNTLKELFNNEALARPESPILFLILTIQHV